MGDEGPTNPYIQSITVILLTRDKDMDGCLEVQFIVHFCQMQQ